MSDFYFTALFWQRGFSGQAKDLQRPEPAVSSFVLPDVANGDDIQISFYFGTNNCAGFNGWEIFEYVVLSMTAGRRVDTPVRVLSGRVS